MLPQQATRRLLCSRSRRVLIVSSTSVCAIGCRQFQGSSRTQLDDRTDEAKEASRVSQVPDVKTESKEFWTSILDSDHKESGVSLWDRVFSTEQDTMIDASRKAGLKTKNETTTPDGKGVLEALATDFMSILSGGGSQKENMNDFISRVRETTEQGEVEDTTSLPDILTMLEKYRKDLEMTAEKYIGAIDVNQLTPTSVAYYLELEDERKNPSWKRRKHRFCQGVDMSKLNELWDMAELARLCYVDSVDEVQQHLNKHTEPCEFVYAQIKSEPGKPAHFIAIPRDQPGGSTLKVIVCVRGTKTVADALTDLLCDEINYRGGRAHGLIVESGKYVATLHRRTLLGLLEQSGKQKLQVVLIGHSLGAGAASIAGIELNDEPMFDVQVFGFGCPALLSLELAQGCDFITTVVNDSDVVPRLSGVAVANLLNSMAEFDWYPYAQRDLRETIAELCARKPMLFNIAIADKIIEFVEPLMERFKDDTIKREHTDPQPVQLYAPGRCIHFWRDGMGFSGNYVPNEFFTEIDVSRRMIEDHLFHSGYQETLLAAARQESRDHHFSFNNDGAN